MGASQIRRLTIDIQSQYEYHHKVTFQDKMTETL